VHFFCWSTQFISIYENVCCFEDIKDKVIYFVNTAEYVNISSSGTRKNERLSKFKKKSAIHCVLENDCITFDRMASTHMLKLERIQCRCLRIVLGMMQYTHVQTLEVIGGVSPLRLRFSMLNHKYLILAFSTGGHPLRQILAVPEQPEQKPEIKINKELPPHHFWCKLTCPIVLF
jgi:hypothetical protein